MARRPASAAVAPSPRPAAAGHHNQPVRTQAGRKQAAHREVARTPVARTPVARTPVARTPVARTPVARHIPAARPQAARIRSAAAPPQADQLAAGRHRPTAGCHSWWTPTAPTVPRRLAPARHANSGTNKIRGPFRLNTQLPNLPNITYIRL